MQEKEPKIKGKQERRMREGEEKKGERLRIVREGRGHEEEGENQKVKDRIEEE